MNMLSYMPVHALRKIDLQSMLSIAFPLLDNEETHQRFDYHHSRRTMLYFLLSMHEMPNNQCIINLLKECDPKVTRDDIEKKYFELKKIIEPYQKKYRAETLGTYWELKEGMPRTGAKQARNYIEKYRGSGFQPYELKMYWNYDQIRQLGTENQFNPTTDSDANEALKRFPVYKRENAGKIKFIQSGIEKAVFKIPNDKQIIVLDFADERMPGGYFLENARTQEEVILYNSDGYRGILDLKYKMMDGGYIIPEYGVSYIKNVRFFQTTSNDEQDERVTDLIIAACYDISGIGEGLYKAPSYSNTEELRMRTYSKFQSIIASAVANTNGNGRGTYLLLGPIGTGAFGNDIRMVSELFSKILNESLMDSQLPIRYAFDEIWFVSIDNLERFSESFRI